MKLAIISDTHFGDPACDLDYRSNSGRLANLIETLGKDNDFLILAGDIFDFSIRSYAEAFNIAKEFFLKIKEANVTKDILFLPGNHDADFWHMVEYEINVTRPIAAGHPPKPLRRAIPAVIDDRKKGAPPTISFPTTELDSVSDRAETNADKKKGVFLDGIFYSPESGSADSNEEPTRFWVAYPNCYLLTDTGECILITHGQYFESYWALGAEVTIGVSAADLKKSGDQLLQNSTIGIPTANSEEVEEKVKLGEHEYFGKYGSIADTVGLNFPLSQLACSGVGQAPPLTKIARMIQRQVKDSTKNNPPKKLYEYLDKLPKALAVSFGFGKWGILWAKAAILFIKHLIKGKLKESVPARYTDGNGEFLSDDAVEKRVGRYLWSCSEELGYINGLLETKKIAPLPFPGSMIFGHTHHTTPWGKGLAFPRSLRTKMITVYNTGGWLEGKQAEVFIYQTGNGMRSKTV